MDSKIKRACKIIEMYGASMTAEQLEKALTVWDKLVKSRFIMGASDPQRSAAAMQKSQGGGQRIRWGSTPRVWGKEAVMVNDTPAPTTKPAFQAPTPRPWGAPAIEYGKADLSELAGHQRAALRAGLDPRTPGLESMTFQEMQAKAAKQTAASVEDIARRAGVCHKNRY